MSKISSNDLYHFTPKFEYIVSILENGFEHKLLEEVLPFTGFKNSVFSIQGIVEHIISPYVVCFCDLPFSLISEHVSEYGRYCIGLSKEWGMSLGITPIRYVHHNTPEISDDTFYTIMETANLLPRLNNSYILMCLKAWNSFNMQKQISIDSVPENIKDYLHMIDKDFFDILKYNISYFGNLRAYEGDWIRRSDGKKITKRFYDEREWRSLKTNKNQPNLKFKAKDISVIIVDSENERRILMEKLKAMMDNLEIPIMEDFVNKIKLIGEIFP